MAEAFERSSTSLTTTGTTDIYTAPSGNAADRAVILGCIAANIDGTNAVDVTIDVTTSGDSKLSSIGQTITVPADSSVEFIANKLILKQGEKLRATASAASGIDCTVSALEITV
jgi:hypothetical protein